MFFLKLLLFIFVYIVIGSVIVGVMSYAGDWDSDTTATALILWPITLVLSVIVFMFNVGKFIGEVINEYKRLRREKRKND